ncbi:sigma-70 family RNA polymerase sigma factor [Pontibacter sp. G13]|uniref:RNA polymerase sigma factor n=1 Tax=Pontibacter sp. G13 TaxID=3074898 RepID=UPI00288AC233|nr:sigma-70 family RNA polymerase sigma factor [Pontibacter sp. G13]WNJ19697.1 sigma-70 family RNA polymerase sigma factor [Pontibacter sp. G13]
MSRFPQHPHEWFEQLFSDNYRVLFALGYRVSKDRELTKDALQGFFMDMWEKRIWEQDIQQPSAYLYRAFYRRIIHEVKAAQKVPTTDIDTQYDLAEDSFEAQLVQVQHQAEKSQRLLQAVGQLPDQQRRMIELRFSKGMDYDQIHEATGKSKQTIYNQIHAGIQKLRNLLK